MFKYDIAVIGGGPAGLMSALRAAQFKKRVVLLEKNEYLGVKLLCTGKGRCNFTNKTDKVKDLVQIYGQNGRFLYSAFNSFGVNDVINFFQENGVESQIERGQRVFPKSGLAVDILNVFKKQLSKYSVDIITQARVKSLSIKNGLIDKIILKDRGEILADKYILCTGGQSYPETGSNGDGYKLASKIGHSIIKPVAILTPLIVKENYIKQAQGLSLKNVEISVYAQNKKIDSRLGEAMFTNNGLSGPIILDMSKNIQANLDKKLFLRIDFKPALDFIKLDKRVQADWQLEPNKMYKNSLTKLLPKKIIPLIIELSKIDPATQVNSITKAQRNTLVHLLKEFDLQIKSLVGFKKAIATAGGIDLKEIDPRTMVSKIIPNLYFAGEIIDIDGPTGGYNLQTCWSTGYLAGQSAANE